MKILLLLFFILTSKQLIANEQGALSDEDFKTSKNYIQKEIYDKAINDCNATPEAKKACSGIDPGLNSTVDGLMDGVAKMYSMLGMISMMSAAGGGAASGSSGIDVCSMIPMATEAIATSTQQSNQQTINAISTLDSSQSNGRNQPKDQIDTQVETLSKSARSLEARGTTSLIQSVGFMTSATCYIKDLAQNTSSLPTTLLKIGAGYGLGTYYLFKNQATKGHRQKVLDIIDKLQGVRGKCNPITQTQCYCSQESTKEDAKYCLPTVYANRKVLGKNLTPISCVDMRMQADPSCRCNVTNTCFNKTFEDFAKIDLGQAFSNNNAKPIASVFNGQLDTPNTLSATKSQLAAIRNLLHAQDPFMGTPRPTNADQLNSAAGLVNTLNLPPGFANKLAMMGHNDESKRMLQKLQGDEQFSLNDMNSTMAFRQASSNTRNSNSTNSNYSGGSIRRAKFDNSEDPQEAQIKPDGSQILEFSSKNVNQAQSEASLHRENQNLFEIVSGRYQKSTWNLFPLNH